MVPLFALRRRISSQTWRGAQRHQVNLPPHMYCCKHSFNFIVRPANILLSHKNIPVLVDFGFAEKYDMTSDTAFHSNLSYGTPEVSHCQNSHHLLASLIFSPI